MGAYTYCSSCLNSMSPPSLADAVLGYQECRCGEKRMLQDFERRLVCEEIEEKLTDREADQ